ncbi:hypothetical protein VNO77_43346 [Canavalia gladiata]|uniref:Uncharacterized protein n=1 Tax=Canavalia gladiata TaxID=3824 RepID=A0AAN9JU21_CANGL
MISSKACYELGKLVHKSLSNMEHLIPSPTSSSQCSMLLQPGEQDLSERDAESVTKRKNVVGGGKERKSAKWFPIPIPRVKACGLLFCFSENKQERKSSRDGYFSVEKKIGSLQCLRVERDVDGECDAVRKEGKSM